MQNPNSKATLKELFDSYDNDLIKSTPGFRTDLFKRKLDEVLITDFFGNVQNVEVDGGDGASMHEDLAALSRLAANLTARYGPEGECVRKPSVPSNKNKKNKKSKKAGEKASSFTPLSPTTAPTSKKVGAMRVEEKDTWGRTVIGGGALIACAIAWVASSAL